MPKHALTTKVSPKLTKTRYFSRMNYQVQRGLREILNERFVSTEEWRLILDFFRDRCAFCGKEHTGSNRTGIIPDHLIPASQYGELCLGNTVPSCQDCNDSRGDKDWRSFIRSSPQGNARALLSRIEKHLKAYPYELITRPEQALAPREHAEYVRILKQWNRLWKDARALRDTVKHRKAARNLTNRWS